jgi:hypothetical protein
VDQHGRMYEVGVDQRKEVKTPQAWTMKRAPWTERQCYKFIISSLVV